MRNVSFLVRASVSVAALALGSAALAQASPAPGQTQQGPATPTTGGDTTQLPPQDQAGTSTESNADIVVTGTRVGGRSRLETASPVDVLSGATIQQQGTTELAQALSNVAPSIDFPRASVVDGTDAIRPATLRGLSPDETLVLINGVRGHPSALLNINSSVGRGAAAVDLNTIPTVALDRIEVLRDGASAEYGSDAIAGVVNLILRQARSGGGATVNYGFYDTDVNTARNSRHVSGEHEFTASAWQGIGFGKDGYITVSGEYLDRQPTSRGDVDLRLPVPRVDSRFGDPEVKQYTGFVNAGTSIGENWGIYGWAGYQYRDTSSAAFPRLPTASSTLAGYPNGFLPLINTHSKDLNSAFGIKGDAGEWHIDAKVSYGRNRIDYRTLNSANFSLLGATPHNFYDGALIYDQLVGGVDVSRKFDVFQSLNVAFGVEGRREGFQIKQGEVNSYTGTGAQGFLGFAPVNEINKHRSNGSAYVDLEAQVTDKFLLGVAGRGEDYSDFGTTATGKISARYDFSHAFALRGTASTGFRAPSLQQSYFTSIASVVQNGVPVLTGTFPSVAPVSVALGGKPLQPEKSTNLSAGAVFRLGGFDLTVDAYQIRLRNQLALSENIAANTTNPATNAIIAALLAPFNVPQARFFINGLASTTKGIDAVGHYRAHTQSAGTFDFTVAANINQIKLTRIPVSTSAIPNITLFARNRQLTMTSGTPGEKVTGTLDWTDGPLGATLRATYYGNVLQPGTTAAADVNTGKHTITDFEFRYHMTKGLQLGLGVDNLFDVYPKAEPININTTGTVGFPFYSPFGFNGRFIYARAGLTW
ncbi:MAG TPA: TonB-dependent receptor [Allosphingosinicella sp.]|jgi:iron complex outermembrane receptor protein|nr:TonB-dependent receptor [Allosphingosinicella sp.]